MNYELRSRNYGNFQFSIINFKIIFNFKILKITLFQNSLSEKNHPLSKTLLF
jgi:hypothetical protein